MAASSNVAIISRGPGWFGGRVPLGSGVHAYRGMMLFIDSNGWGTATAGGNTFAGVVRAEADNSDGGDGALEAEVVDGIFEHLTGSGFAQSDLGGSLYASDSNTLTTTASGNSLVGKVFKYVSSTAVHFMSSGLQA